MLGSGLRGWFAVDDRVARNAARQDPVGESIAEGRAWGTPGRHTRVDTPVDGKRGRIVVGFWYRQLQVIDGEIVGGGVPRARLESDLALLERLDQDVSGSEVPLSCMEEFYNLRLHIAYMRQRVKEALAEAG